MQQVRVLDVGHGLCVAIGCLDDVFVFDCGSHNQRTGAQRSWQRLVERTAFEEIETIALSHLHRDHYNGLLKPFPNLRPDVKFVVARMPLIEDDPGLGSEFLLRLMSVAPLDPKLGPLDLDLLRRVRQWAPKLEAKPVSRGEYLDAAGERWKVLWPPESIPSVEFGATIRAAIKAYDRAAKEHKWLKKRLEQMRESTTYTELLNRMNESRDHGATPLEDEHFGDFDVPEDNQQGDSDLSVDHQQQGDDLLKKAGTSLRDAANDMSLVLASDSGVLLTGDASRSAMKRALARDLGSYSLVVTPHHGGENHVPSAACDKTLSSRLWVSSAGGQMSSHVSDFYDTLPGLHFRTDRHHDVDLLVTQHSVDAINAGFRRRFWDHPFYPMYTR